MLFTYFGRIWQKQGFVNIYSLWHFPNCLKSVHWISYLFKVIQEYADLVWIGLAVRVIIFWSKTVSANFLLSGPLVWRQINFNMSFVTNLATKSNEIFSMEVWTTLGWIHSNNCKFQAKIVKTKSPICVVTILFFGAKIQICYCSFKTEN